MANTFKRANSNNKLIGQLDPIMRNLQDTDDFVGYEPASSATYKVTFKQVKDNLKNSIGGLQYLKDGQTSGSLRSINSIPEGNNYSLGLNAVSLGNVTKAPGDNAFAEGLATSAEGKNSHAQGTATKASGENAHSEGITTIASGYASHTEGAGTKATQSQSHAEGTNTTASGIAAHAEGWETTAEGIYSHSEGYHTYASSTASHAEGYYTFASSTASHAEGGGTEATGDFSHAQGRTSRASGFSAHAEGQSCIAAGDYSHVEGFTVSATGKCAHAEGSNNIAYEDYSHVEGWNSRSSNIASHAEGQASYATGRASHAEGYQANAEGDYSHAEGYNTQASSTASHAEGMSTTATIAGQHVQGRYNVTDNTAADIVGWGDSGTSKNIYTLTTAGHGKFASKVTAGADATESMDLVTYHQLQASTSSGGTYSLTQDATDKHKLIWSGTGVTQTTYTIPDNNTTYSLSYVHGVNPTTVAPRIHLVSNGSTTSSIILQLASTGSHGLLRSCPQYNRGQYILNGFNKWVKPQQAINETTPVGAVVHSFSSNPPVDAGSSTQTWSTIYQLTQWGGDTGRIAGQMCFAGYFNTTEEGTIFTVNIPGLAESGATTATKLGIPANGFIRCYCNGKRYRYNATTDTKFTTRSIIGDNISVETDSLPIVTSSSESLTTDMNFTVHTKGLKIYDFDGNDVFFHKRLT